MLSAWLNSVSKTHDRPLLTEMSSGCSGWTTFPAEEASKLGLGCFQSLSFLPEAPEFHTRGLSQDSCILRNF